MKIYRNQNYMVTEFTDLEMLWGNLIFGTIQKTHKKVQKNWILPKYYATDCMPSY